MTSDEVTQMLKAMDKTGSNTVTLDGVPTHLTPPLDPDDGSVAEPSIVSQPALRAEFEVWWLDRKTNGEYIGNFNTDVLKGVLPNT